MKTRLALAGSVALLVTAACVYLVWRTPPAESLPTANGETHAPDADAVDAELASAAEGSDAQSTEGSTEGVVRRSPVTDEPLGDLAAVPRTRVLRVTLEGISETELQRATITLAGRDEHAPWPGKIQVSWPCQGRTSELDMEPFFTRVEEQGASLRDDEVEVSVDHPLHFSDKDRFALSSGEELESGQTVYEVRLRMVEVVYWPESTLAVRDVNTRAHLEGVELRCVPTAFMGLLQQPGTGEPFTPLGADLGSPIVLRGGRKAGAAEDMVAGLALSPAAGEAPEPAELDQPEETERGVMVYARAPGYAWGRIVLDLSKGAERELLLDPGAALAVRLENVQLERYAALERDATLWIKRVRPEGGETPAWHRRLDETLAGEGARIEALVPGEYAVSVELGRSLFGRTPQVHAREELSLAAGEERELVLSLPDAPAPTERATLGGLVSFPAFGGEESVRLQLYESDYRYGDADVELALADMERVGGALPTWSFRLADLPVGRYQVQLMPFQKNWMVELPAGGREDVELVVPQLAEVLVETVDARTGERIPLEVIRYAYQEELPGRVHREWSTIRTTVRFDGEPGRFRFWTAPGSAYVATYRLPSELNLGVRRQALELVPGLQSVKFELAPACTIRLEFRVDGAALPYEDAIFHGLSRCIRAVGHEGRVGTLKYWLLQASAPGLYEITFEGVGEDRFLPIPARRVEVLAGETTDVIVDLQRK